MKTPHDLVEKYNRAGPRYTSYPPVPFWNNNLKEQDWVAHLKASYRPEMGVDLYVHVPFCETLCYYCGCSRTITKNHDVEKDYLSLILKEWALYQERLGFIPKINSLHLGGGTPTFLSSENLNLLVSHLLRTKTPAFVGSIEIDPRTCKKEHIDVLVKNEFSRVSLGIQDFDPEVQKAINRFQPVSLIEGLMSELRSKGIMSINFDLIYGLPNQSLETVRRTVQEVARLSPDLIAFYSYAHLPEKIRNQRLIDEKTLPQGAEKRELYETGKTLLREEGFVEIGMDHFAKEKSFLYRAKQENKLNRNFMGYLDKKSNVLIGLGPTAISESGDSFSQNQKELKAYRELISKGSLPVEKGHHLSLEDKEAQMIIQNLMCQERAEISDHLVHNKLILKELQELENDGILRRNENVISITELGKPFIRNVAMIFDHHLRARTMCIKFSQTI
jgi:oxygen-independent coproporphyrinogen III oxidase